MTQLINNREYRQKALQKIIKELHHGKPVEEVKAKFEELIDGLDPREISLMEAALIKEGLPVEEVQRLCDVHAAVFRNALEKVHHEETPLGHPVHTFKAENRALENLIENEIQPSLNELRTASGDGEREAALKLAEKVNLLWDVDKHYSRKENLVFPYLEKYGITGPPQVMWGVDDEIRALLKEARNLAVNYSLQQKQQLITEVEQAVSKAKEMIFKEENILFPTALETLSEDEWLRILEDSPEIGYCLIEPEKGWKPIRENVAEDDKALASEKTQGYIKFNSGVLKPEEISLIFNHLPVDITFVDKDGVVKYFSEGTERIFPRPRSIIGRKVENCHPPGSVHIVEKLVQELQSGEKDSADFWLHLGENYVLIQYFAVRNESGEFMGVLEVSQNIKPIQAISGEKRLAD